MENLFIDIFDGLSAETSAEGVWSAACSHASKLGISSVLVAKIDPHSLLPAWVNTDMPSDWMAEYLEQNYIQIDPLVAGLKRGSGMQILSSGAVTKNSSHSKQEYEFDAGLRATGLEHLICNSFVQPASLGTNVTFGFAKMSATEITHWRGASQVLASLFAVNIQSPLDDQNNRIVRQKVPRLTPRQKDVLCLLANGFQTARIAEFLKITEPAVSFHFASARRALGAQTREHALAIALKWELISP